MVGYNLKIPTKFLDPLKISMYFFLNFLVNFSLFFAYLGKNNGFYCLILIE